MNNDRTKDLIIVLIIVYNINIVHESRWVLGQFRKRLDEEFDVKLFGKLSSIIDWEIIFQSDATKVTQMRNLESLPTKQDILEVNGAWNPLADLTKASDQDIMLSRPQNGK